MAHIKVMLLKISSLQIIYIYIYIYICVCVCVCVCVFTELVSNNLQSLTCHKTQPTHQPANQKDEYVLTYPSSQVGYDTKSVFNLNLTGLNYIFLLLAWLPK